MSVVINPSAPRRWTIRVRVTDVAAASLAPQGEQQWAIWCGADPLMIRVLKATAGCHFDQASKRWFFFKPRSEYGATLQRLINLGYRINLEDPRGHDR